jgi:hypothetical protein
MRAREDHEHTARVLDSSADLGAAAIELLDCDERNPYGHHGDRDRGAHRVGKHQDSASERQNGEVSSARQPRSVMRRQFMPMLHSDHLSSRVKPTTRTGR